MTKHCDDAFPDDAVVVSGEDAESPIYDEVVDEQQTFWVRPEFREVDPGLAAAQQYTGPTPDPAVMSWTEAGLPASDGELGNPGEHPTVEYGGPQDAPAPEHDPTTEIAEAKAESEPVPTQGAPQSPSFDPVPKMLLTVPEEKQIVLERIKEIERGMFRDELIRYELLATGQDGGPMEERVVAALHSLQALANLFNDRYEG